MIRNGMILVLAFLILIILLFHWIRYAEYLTIPIVLSEVATLGQDHENRFRGVLRTDKENIYSLRPDMLTTMHLLSPTGVNYSVGGRITRIVPDSVKNQALVHIYLTGLPPQWDQWSQEIPGSLVICIGRTSLLSKIFQPVFRYFNPNKEYE